MAELILYNYFRSSASYRARIALHWKGLAFEYRAVHLLDGGGQQHKAEYRDLNPAGEVPTLIYQGKPIAQSMAILELLEEVYPAKPLLPKDPVQRALVRQFCENINCTQPYQNLKTLQFLEKTVGLGEAIKQQWLDNWLGNGLATAEKMIEQHGGKFCFGNEVTLADVFLVPQLFATNRFKIAMEPYPNVRAVNESLLALEPFKKAHPANQPDTPPA